MARVPVMNPPGKLTRPRLYKRKKRLYRGPKSTLKPHTRLANPRHKHKTLKRKTRRKAHAVRSRATVRRKSHKRSTRAMFNPFGSEMIMLGNPSKGGGHSSRGHSSRRRRKSSMARKKRSHRRRRHALSNPFSVSALMSKPKEMFTKDFATEAVSVAAGFMGPNIVLGYVPPQFRDTKIKFFAVKTAVVIGLSAGAGIVSKRASRMVLIGGGVSILLDLWQDWQASQAPKAPAAPGTGAYYGPEGTGAYYGNDLGDNGDDGATY